MRPKLPARSSASKPCPALLTELALIIFFIGRQVLAGEPIRVSGVVIAPRGIAPPGGRPIVAWAHPTTGIVSRCAPSLAHVFVQLGPGARRGCWLAAMSWRRPTIRASEAQEFIPISSARARRERSSIPCVRQEKFRKQGQGTGLRFGAIPREVRRPSSPASTPAARPELKLVGVAAAAPATDLEALVTEDLGTGGGNNITAMTLWSWSQIYGAPMANVVAPGAEPVIDHLANLSIERWFDVLTRRGSTQALEKSFLRVDNLVDREPWRRLLEENSPGTLARDIPVFLAQGSADRLCEPRSPRPTARASARMAVRSILSWRVGRSTPSSPGMSLARRWPGSQAASPGSRRPAIAANKATGALLQPLSIST